MSGSPTGSLSSSLSSGLTGSLGSSQPGNPHRAEGTALHAASQHADLGVKPRGTGVQARLSLLGAGVWAQGVWGHGVWVQYVVLSVL